MGLAERNLSACGQDRFLLDKASVDTAKVQKERIDNEHYTGDQLHSSQLVPGEWRRPPRRHSLSPSGRTKDGVMALDNVSFAFRRGGIHALRPVTSKNKDA
jgi:hypothetical protein